MPNQLWESQEELGILTMEEFRSPEVKKELEKAVSASPLHSFQGPHSRHLWILTLRP